MEATQFSHAVPGQSRFNSVGPSASSPLASQPAGICPVCLLSGWFPASAGCGISAAALPCSGGHGLCAPGSGLPGRLRLGSSAASSRCSNLGFTHFKRRRRGNLQVGGTGRLGVPAYRGWLRTVKNLLPPATGDVAPGRWRPRRWATACRTRPPGVGSWGAVFATRGRPRWSKRRAPAGRGWCGRWPGRTTGVGSPRPSGSAPPERACPVLDTG